MTRERRQPTHAEWKRITTRRPVVRRLPNSKKRPRTKKARKRDAVDSQEEG